MKLAIILSFFLITFQAFAAGGGDCTFCDEGMEAGQGGNAGTILQCSYLDGSNQKRYQAVNVADVARANLKTENLVALCSDGIADPKSNVKAIGFLDASSAADTTTLNNQGELAIAQTASSTQAVETESIEISGIGSISVNLTDINLVGQYDGTVATPPANACLSLCDCPANQWCGGGTCKPYDPMGLMPPTVDVHDGSCVKTCTSGPGGNCGSCLASHSYACYPPGGGTPSACEAADGIEQIVSHSFGSFSTTCANTMPWVEANIEGNNSNPRNTGACNTATGQPNPTIFADTIECLEPGAPGNPNSKPSVKILHCCPEATPAATGVACTGSCLCVDGYRTSDGYCRNSSDPSPEATVGFELENAGVLERYYSSGSWGSPTYSACSAGSCHDGVACTDSCACGTGKFCYEGYCRDASIAVSPEDYNVQVKNASNQLVTTNLYDGSTSGSPTACTPECNNPCDCSPQRGKTCISGQCVDALDGGASCVYPNVYFTDPGDGSMSQCLYCDGYTPVCSMTPPACAGF